MFTRLVHSGAVLGIASGLVFLPVVTAAADGALNIVQEVAQNGLKLVASDGVLTEGAVTAAIPEAVVACTGPQVVGCALITAAIGGAVLYATKDTWLPWLQNSFGQGGASEQGGTPSVLFTTTLVVWAGSATVSVQQSGQASNPFITWESNSGQCKNMTTGSLSSMASRAGETIDPYMGAGTSRVLSPSTCPAGSEVVSFDAQFVSGTAVNPGGLLSPNMHWGASFDPAVKSTVTTTVDCVKPDGTTGTVSVATINPDGGVLVPSCVAAFGPGSHGTKLALNGGETGAPPQPLSTISVPTTSALYPNCVGGGVACTYVVSFKGTPCVVGNPDCVDWALQSQVDGNADYSCTYGGYTMPLAGCALDERAYETTPHRLSRLNTDGNPMTWDGPRPSWVTDPNVSGDPNPLPLPGAVPLAPPAGAPGGAPLPIPGAPLPSPGPGPSSTADCWPGGVAAWNPVAWVLQPIQCALSWAFVPSEAAVGELARSAEVDLTAQGIGPIAVAVGTNLTKIGTGTGCEGPPVTFSAVGVVKPMHPFSACTQPMSTLASISYAVTTVVVILGGGWAALVAVGAGFGFNLKRGAGSVST